MSASLFSQDNDPANAGGGAHDSSNTDHEASIPQDMKQAISSFISARLELLALESKEAGEVAARKVVHAVILALCAFFTWALILAGLTGILAPFLDRAIGSDWLPGWAAVLLLLALVHGIGAFVFFRKLKQKPGTPLFELSRQEIENDKQWLKKTP